MGLVKKLALVGIAWLLIIIAMVYILTWNLHVYPTCEENPAFCDIDDSEFCACIPESVGEFELKKCTSPYEKAFSVEYVRSSFGSAKTIGVNVYDSPIAFAYNDVVQFFGYEAIRGGPSIYIQTDNFVAIISLTDSSVEHTRDESLDVEYLEGLENMGKAMQCVRGASGVKTISSIDGMVRTGGVCAIDSNCYEHLCSSDADCYVSQWCGCVNATYFWSVSMIMNKDCNKSCVCNEGRCGRLLPVDAPSGAEEVVTLVEDEYLDVAALELPSELNAAYCGSGVVLVKSGSADVLAESDVLRVLGVDASEQVGYGVVSGTVSSCQQFPDVLVTVFNGVSGDEVSGALSNVVEYSDGSSREYRAFVPLPPNFEGVRDKAWFGAYFAELKLADGFMFGKSSRVIAVVPVSGSVYVFEGASMLTVDAVVSASIPKN